MSRHLHPSDIYYSQDSIRPRFSNGSELYEVLGDIRAGRASVNNIPKIQVARKDNKWFALDNRRLWLFKQLEQSGHVGKIHVIEVSSIPENKFTTENGGTSVRMRRDRGSDSEDDYGFGYDSDSDKNSFDDSFDNDYF